MRVHTQAASLRIERQSSDQLPSHDTPEAARNNSSETDSAANIRFSANLRPELRSVNEARLAALRGYTRVEDQEEEWTDTNDTLNKLRRLADGHRDDDAEDATEYLAIQDQIRRLKEAQGRDRSEHGFQDVERQLGADYFGSEDAFEQTRTTRANPKSASAMEAAIEKVSEYGDYLKAVKKRLTTRLDRLSEMTRDLCEAPAPIDTDDFADDVAKFTHAKILGEAQKSAGTHPSLTPQVALSLIAKN